MKEKIKEDLLKYEIEMFNIASNYLLTKKYQNKFEMSVFVEIFALHTRVLIDFFYKNKRHKDDILAKDFFDNKKWWEKIRPPETSLLKEAQCKADKQLAHLTYNRLKRTTLETKGWKVGEITKEINELINLFENQLLIYNEWRVEIR